MTLSSQPPPGERTQQLLFTALARLVHDYVAKGTEYGEIGAVQFAVKAAHHARDWHQHVRGADEPPPPWLVQQLRMLGVTL